MFLRILYKIHTGLNSFGGIQYKSAGCPLPCTHVTVQSAFQDSGNGYAYNAFFLFVENDVVIEKVIKISLDF